MKRFDDFVKALEKLSVKYGVTIQSVGGVSIYDEGDIAAIEYSRDPTSGDLMVCNVVFTPDMDESPSVSL
jgi:hypothetical protein